MMVLKCWIASVFKLRSQIYTLIRINQTNYCPLHLHYVTTKDVIVLHHKGLFCKATEKVLNVDISALVNDVL